MADNSHLYTHNVHDTSARLAGKQLNGRPINTSPLSATTLSKSHGNLMRVCSLLSVSA